MTAHPDERTLRIAARIDALVAEEARLVAAQRAHVEKAEKADAELMAACRQVGAASDRVEQCKFAGASEFQARRKLDAAAKVLATLMRKHGRAF